ncbi:MAG: GNAT family N-acetyltransferase [Bacteroidetes bacterium]|nr:MAG: GNAT family N-acetyltransferase [Bacteroidota bacterium]
MEIRKAGLADLEPLTTLFDAYRQFYDKASDPEAARNFLHKRIAREESVIYIAWNDAAEALGFVQLYPSFSSVNLKRLWILNDLFVVKKNRRKGVATKLIAQAKELAEQTGAHGLMLETEVDNTMAKKLYEKLGFKKNDDYDVYCLNL